MSTLAFGAEIRNAPIESVDQLVELYHRSYKPTSRHRVGLELEAMPVRADGSPVPYEAPQGPSIRALLERLGSASGMRPTFEHQHLIGLEGPEGTVSLEPGGQVEFSTLPAATLHEVSDLAARHLRHLREASRQIDLHWAELGYQPIASLEETEWMPKERYRIMREYLPTKGRLALRMMSQTASIQCSFDFSDEDDLQRKFRATNRLTPLVQAIFANSPFRHGRASRYLSYRTQIWEQTDPERCGLLPLAFEEGDIPERYVQYALDVPMMFLLRNDRWLPMRGFSFREFLRRGYEGRAPTLADWGLHLSGVFTQVRLKAFVEVRAHDLVPAEMVLAVPALWKGILYDREAMEAALDLVRGLSYRQAAALMGAVARNGLRAEHRGRPLLEAARELLRIASKGLQRQGKRRADDGRDERIYLEPIEELLARGLTPAELFLQRYQRDWKGDLLKALI
ncbi:MAG: glutamate-cysteine ligase family protein [Acidobacteriota bacterium]